MFRSFCLIAALAATEAFVLSTTGRQNNNFPALGLTTDDGMDLVAASQQMYRRHHQDLDANDDDYDDHDDDDNEYFHQAAAVEDDTVPPSVITAPRGAALAFVKRLFAQPTAAFHPHEAEGLDSYQGDSDGDDVVYFPIVGFTFVQDGPNHCRALPSISNPSCRIRGDACDHVHYGTWSPAKKA